MGCYLCDGPDGTDVILCPDCRVRRDKEKISIEEAVNKSPGKWLPYLRIIKEEWHLAIGFAVMVFVSVNAFIYFFCNVDMIFDPSGLHGPGPEQLYSSCVSQLEAVDVSTIDYQSLSAGYTDEINEYLSSPHSSEAGKELDPLKFLISLRAKESCSAAKKACTEGPESADCASFVATYLRKGTGIQAPEH